MSPKSNRKSDELRSADDWRRQRLLAHPPPVHPGRSRTAASFQSPRTLRVAVFLLVALAASLLTGVALTRLDPIFIGGAVAALLCVYIIVMHPFVGLVLYTAAFLLHPGLIYPVLAPLHLERVIGVLALAGMFLQQHRESRRISLDWRPQTRYFLILLILIAASIPFAYWRSAAVDGLIDFLKLAAWYFLVVHLVNTRRRLRIYLAVFLVLVCYSGFAAFTDYLAGKSVYSQGIDRAHGLTGTLGGANALGAEMTVTIPILLALTFCREARWFRLGSVIAVVLLTMTMVVSGSRSALVGLCGALLFMWWHSGNRLLAGLVGAMIIAVGAQFIPEQYVERYGTMFQDELDGSSRGRVVLWQKGVRMIADRPLTGVGIKCFGTANALAYSPPGRPSYMVSHNLFFQVPAEIGIPGAIVFFLFLRAVFQTSRATKRKLVDARSSWGIELALVRGLAAGFVALLITGFFGGNFYRYTWYVYAAFNCAVARILETEASDPGTSGAPP